MAKGPKLPDEKVVASAVEAVFLFGTSFLLVARRCWQSEDSVENDFKSLCINAKKVGVCVAAALEPLTK